MLNLILKKSGSKLEFNIDSQFMTVNIPDTELNRLLVKDIDQGEYVNNHKFIDRFGYTMRLSDLSTGCKAALLVANTNKIVDLQECGFNAISSIIRHCKSGTAILIDRGLTIPYDGNDKDILIDVAIDGYHVKDLWTLNYYLKYGIDLDDEEYNAEKLDIQ